MNRRSLLKALAFAFPTSVAINKAFLKEPIKQHKFEWFDEEELEIIK